VGLPSPVVPISIIVDSGWTTRRISTPSTLLASQAG